MSARDNHVQTEASFQSPGDTRGSDLRPVDPTTDAMRPSKAALAREIHKMVRQSGWRKTVDLIAKAVVILGGTAQVGGSAMAASMLATAYPVDVTKQEIPGRAVDPASDATKPANITVAEARAAVGTNPSPTALAAMASRFAKPKVLACRP